MGNAYGEDSKDGRETADDVERRLEQNYVFDRAAYSGEGLSILSIVAANQDDLAEEFLRWWSMSPARGFWWQDLPTWERAKFGAELFRAAHGVLSFAVRSRVGGPRTTAPTPRLTPGLTGTQRRDRMLGALDKVIEAKTMPGVGLKLDADEMAGRVPGEEG